MVMAAHGLPSLLRLRVMPVSTPHSFTSAFFCQALQVAAVVSGQFGHFVGIAVQRMAGHPEAQHLFFAGELLLVGPLGHVGQRRWRAALRQSGRRTGPPGRFRGRARRAGRLPWRLPPRRTSATAPPSSESMAPARIRLSIMRRLTAPRSTFSQNWCSDWKRPTSCARAADGFHGRLAQVLHRAQAEADGAGPSSGVKLHSLAFTSGGRMVMPISRHSLMYFTTLAVLPVSEVSSAAMKSTG